MDTKMTMRDYIYATPDRVTANADRAQELVKPLVDLYCRKDYRNIVIAASGSSYTAAQCARIYLARTLKTDVKIITPYTFAHYDCDLLREDDFMFIISQSGASTNGIEVLKRLRDRGHETIALTGNVESDFKEYCDHILDWGCGYESVGYVTLGVVTLISYLMMFAAFAAREKGYGDETGHCISQIRKAMENHREVCNATESFVKANYKSLSGMERIYVCGCGSNFGTALEGALKIGETIKVPAIGYELDEVLHGPALQLSPRYTLFLVDGNDDTGAHARQLYHAACHVSDNVYIISNDPGIEDTHALRIPDPCEEPFSCLHNLPFFELIAHMISSDLDTIKNHPLYYEMNKTLDFRTANFRKKTAVKDD